MLNAELQHTASASTRTSTALVNNTRGHLHSSTQQQQPKLKKPQQHQPRNQLLKHTPQKTLSTALAGEAHGSIQNNSTYYINIAHRNITHRSIIHSSSFDNNNNNSKSTSSNRTRSNIIHRLTTKRLRHCKWFLTHSFVNSLRFFNTVALMLCKKVSFRTLF